MDARDLLGLSTEIIAAYIGQNTLSAAELPDLIQTVHATLSSLAAPAPPAALPEKQKPAVPIGRSV